MDESAQINTEGGTPTVNYSIVQGGWTGAGGNNLNADPLFVDPNGADDVVGTVDDNLRLRSGSPAIDRVHRNCRRDYGLCTVPLFHLSVRHDSASRAEMRQRHYSDWQYWFVRKTRSR